MIERAILAVHGPSGSGKTTFIEHLLGATGRPMQAVRCHHDPNLTDPSENSPSGDPELERYRAAGADRTSVYRFPEPDSEEFFHSDLMVEDPSDVVLEGDPPLPYVDLDVFVAPAPAPRGKLLRRVKRDAAKLRRADAVRLRKLLRAVDDTDPGIDQLLGLPLSRLAAIQPQVTESFRHGVKTELDRMVSAESPPEWVERWELTKRYQGIESAGLVVIDVRGPADRRRGEAALDDLRRLRSDEAVFHDIFGVQGSRVPITAVVADLGDALDPGLKKAILRCRRVCKSAATHC